MKTYKSFSDLGAAFSKFVDDTFIVHHGNLLEKKGTGYIMSGKYYGSLEEVDSALDDIYYKWNKSIILNEKRKSNRTGE